MLIDNQLIAYLEDLSYLTFSDEEKKRLEEDLGKIFKNISVLNNLNTDDVKEFKHSFDNVNAFREDKVQPSFDRELILKNAPVRNDEFFVAPKTVE